MFSQVVTARGGCRKRGKTLSARAPTSSCCRSMLKKGEVFLRQVHAYALHSGDFEDTQYPSQDADAAEEWSWWQCKQPAALLGKIALRLWRMPCSQGASERSWSRMGRQVQPVRSLLGATSKRKLMFASTNYVRVPTVRAVNGNDEDGHGACKRQTVAVPGKDMAAPAPVEAELV